MRTTLACGWCRRSKIKCVHNGTAPCRSCKGTSRQSACELSKPDTKGLASGRATRQKKHQSRPHTNTEAVIEGIAGHSDVTLGNGRETEPRPNPDGAVRFPPSKILIAAGRHLVHRFPSVSIVHPPSFFQSLRNGTFDHGVVCGMLALCARFVPELIDEFGSAAKAGKYFAESVRREIDGRMREGPCLETIHCLLLLGMYEWGECSGFAAWMYVGMGIRMSQALKLHPELITPSISTSAEQAVIRQELHDRTIWSCFILDRLLGCGKDRPTIFVRAEMRIPYPLSETDFAFGDTRDRRGEMSTESPDSTSLVTWNIDYYFAIIVHGIDLYATLARWTANGGRKRYQGLEDCPWEPTSKWYKIHRDLEVWRSYQDERVKYSSGRLSAQIYQTHPEAFAFINLLYYLCLTVLHRDFIPLLPLRITGPIGPNESPFFLAEAPAGWWERSADVLYRAADDVAHILGELSKADNPPMSPLAGFCAFSAALTLSHLAAFPHMNPGKPIDSTSKAETCMAYLVQFAKFFKIGEDWISTLTDARELFERALSDGSSYAGKNLRLHGRKLEYGSIVLTDKSPGGATSIVEETQGEPMLEHTPLPSHSGGDGSRNDEHLADAQTGIYPEADLEEDFWGLNDVLLSQQQHVFSFTMGGEAGTFV